MLNDDIRQRFDDWLISPSETLDFEVKQWLDMSDAEAQGTVAKALIALENHGGGFLLFGYKEDSAGRLGPDANRPDSLQQYATDALNAIVKARAEPSFHVEVTLQRHPETGEEYPLARVSGRSKVPVRSASATAKGSLRQNVYYIRAAGPESRGPGSAAEWDTLLRRSLVQQRTEIVDLLRGLLPGAPDLLQAPGHEVSAQLLAFVNASQQRWDHLNAALPKEHPGRISLGYFAFAAKIVGAAKGVTTRAIVEANSASRRYTGWPIFVSGPDDLTRPKLVEGCIEAWLANAQFSDPSHADYWRIDPAGMFFQLRGYQEDVPDGERRIGQPGKLFELTLPVWRLGEFLIKVLDLGEVMFEPGFEVVVRCTWNGVSGRVLYSHTGRRHLRERRAATPSVTTEGRFAQDKVRTLLPEVVQALTMPLYESFDFFEPPQNFFAEEIAGLTTGRF